MEIFRNVFQLQGILEAYGVLCKTRFYKVNILGLAIKLEGGGGVGCDVIEDGRQFYLSLHFPWKVQNLHVLHSLVVHK